MTLEVPRQDQRQRNFHDFGRLNVADPRNFQPAARAFDHFAAECDADQQHDADDVKRHRKPRNKLRRQIGNEDHDPHGDDDFLRLRSDPTKGLVGGAVQHQQTQRSNRRDNRKQKRIKVIGELGPHLLNHRARFTSAATLAAAIASLPTIGFLMAASSSVESK